MGMKPPRPAARKLSKNKRGIFFTLMSIIIVTLMILTITTIPQPRISTQSDVVEFRVETMNDFVIDLNDDLERAAQIIGHTSLLLLGQAITSNGSYLTDINADFQDVFWNGTMNSSGIVLQNNDTFLDYTERIATHAQALGILTSIGVEEIELSQADPWTVQVRVQIQINVTDGKATAKWKQRKNITAYISIIGMEDPVYSVESYGRLGKTIQKTNITTFVVGGVTDGLKAFTNASQYRNSTEAPTFLMRYMGNFSSHPQGIESIIYLQEFIQQGLPTFDRSVVDHEYFSGSDDTPYDIINVTDTAGWTWFRLDANSSARYGATHLMN